MAKKKKSRQAQLEKKCEKLKPYKSFLFCSMDAKNFSTAHLDIQKLVKKTGGTIKDKTKPFKKDGLEIAFFTYIDKKTPSWLTASGIKDTIHHLVLLARRNKYVAIFASDSRIRGRIRGHILDKRKKKEKKFGYLGLIERGYLNAAFIKGQTQTLWLSGTHRRVASKVDNKIITGMDLQYALDPLGDRTFRYTAARSKLPPDVFEQPVGVSPKNSSLWVGISKNWADFIKSTKLLLTLIEEAKEPKTNPLPVLAASIISKDELKSIEKPYDAAIIPPVLLAEGDTDPELLKKAERWSNLCFGFAKKGRKKGKPDFNAAVFFYEDGKKQQIGTFRFIFDLSRFPVIDWKVKGKIGAAKNEELFNEALDIFQNNKEWLEIWYDSGHVIVDREIILPRYQDVPFNDYKWQKLKRYDITKEKPAGPIAQNIGKENSLFCYVQKTLRQGWLTCDDGSMEIADFIHFDNTQPLLPLIRFIHVKASDSKLVNRQISVANYEVVVAQAIKNLRYLGRENLVDGLTRGLARNIQTATWKDGQPKGNRKQMIKEIENTGVNLDTRVVVFQPRLTKSAWDKATKSKDSQNKQRLYQLNTLLLACSNNCRSLGSDFRVWADGR